MAGIGTLKFKQNITQKIETSNLERQLLHALLMDKLCLMRMIGKHRSEFFTVQSRLFIYDCIMRTFSEKHCILTNDQFEFEIEKRFDPEKDKARIDDIKTEFELVRKIAQTESAEAIAQNLEEVQLANSTEAIIQDAYKELEKGNYAEAADLLKRNSINLGSMQKENRIYNLHKDNEDWFQEVKKRHDNPELYAGIPTGFKKFDEMTGGLFPAELTVVFGLSGKGKSTLMKAMACNIRKTGRNVLHCGNEENEFQMRSKYMSADSGALYSHFKRGRYTDEEYDSLKKYSDGQKKAEGSIYIYEFPQQTDATWIERAYHQLEMQGIKIDVIVVDYLDLMKPCEKAYSENDEGGKVTSDLKQVAINCNVPVITATQAGIQSEKQEKKDKPFLNQSDVFGTKRKVHSANVLIGIVNQTATAQAQEGEKPPEMHHLVLCVPKNRDGSAFVFRQKMYAPTGVFYEEDGDSPDEVALQAIAEQAAKMCDDTVAPGEMVKEISMDAINDAKQKDQQRQLAEIEETLSKEGVQSDLGKVENKDDSVNSFLSGTPESSSAQEQEQEPEQEEEKTDAVSDFIGGGETGDESEGDYAEDEYSEDDDQDDGMEQEEQEEQEEESPSIEEEKSSDMEEEHGDDGQAEQQAETVGNDAGSQSEPPPKEEPPAEKPDRTSEDIPHYKPLYKIFGGNMKK